MSMPMQEIIQKRPASHTRVDAAERITGAAKYAGDWVKDEMLYARIVTGSVPHGIVRKIDSSAASLMPGFADIVTCFDDSTVWHAGEREHDRRVFTDHVRFIGDCIGAVTATTRIAAKKAAESVETEYEDLPATFTINSSMESRVNKIWNDGNNIPLLRYGYGDSASTFEKAATLLERHYSTSRVANVPLEPAISLAWWEGEMLTVVAATQSIHGCRKGIARDLGLPEELVRVITLYKGGGFGNKANSMNYDLIAAICSKRTGKPVMVEYSREDEFVSVHGRWSSEQDLKLASDRNGRIMGMEVRARCDVGAYARHVKPGKFIEGPENYYSTDSWMAEILPVYTNTPATGHMRAPPGPQSCFAAETIVDELAFKLKEDPFDIRWRNRIVSPHHGKAFTSNGLADCLSIGAEEFGWKRRWKPPSLKESQEGIVKGVGMAMASWHSRLGPGEATVKVSGEGKVTVITGVVDIGTGAKTTMAMIASKVLGTSMEQVEIVWGDTGTTPFSIGESGGRTTTYTGYAVREAARKAKEELLSIASAYLGVTSESICIDGSLLKDSMTGEAKCRIFDALSSAGKEEIVTTVSTQPSLPDDVEFFSFAAHFAEVTVDLGTGEVKVTDYLAVHDSGEIVNSLTARSQVQGGIVMGIGMALTEKLQISERNGTIENPSLLLYRLPNTVHVPEIKVKFTGTEDPFGPKSLGELPIVPVPAAIGNAIFNATGVRLRSLPFSREALYRELQAGPVKVDP